ncbi:hypothetical protein [Sulfurospirillum barnesii]|uniref:Uncharacterized protein n=1 Tax=Sulfurospirillum barnesii (strain ATCC 700032 / DSM 10660 / SES-3) TaxID=760154 RepID=I3XVZ5_SULBS|nr:hypothetical protein [Sulfurospirillum barnesii]AFL68119.1 hypothetical protein Sulba_0816 [Sulfurospirillum barnesii SES-3]
MEVGVKSMEEKEIKDNKILNSRSNQNKPSLQTILTIVGLGLTIIAYIMGKAYYDTYMYSFGLSSDFFPISTQDIYFYSYGAVLYGFSALMEILKRNLLSIIISATFVIGIMVFLALRPKNEKSILVKFPFLEKFFSSTKIQFFIQLLTTTFAGVYLFTLFIYVLTLVLMFALYLYVGPQSVGEKMAAKKINEYREHGCYVPENSQANTCIQILNKDNQEVAKGVLIAYDNNKIAFLNDKGSQIITFPTDGKIIVDVNITKK